MESPDLSSPCVALVTEQRSPRQRRRVGHGLLCAQSSAWLASPRPSGSSPSPHVLGLCSSKLWHIFAFSVFPCGSFYEILWSGSCFMLQAVRNEIGERYSIWLQWLLILICCESRGSFLFFLLWTCMLLLLQSAWGTCHVKERGLMKDRGKSSASIL